MRGKLAVFLILALLFPLTALADSISPDTFSKALDVGESFTLHKTVTITETPGSAKLDVNFLFDTTGSMGGLISNAKTSATAITNNLSAFGDVTFGVGHYEDFYSYYHGWGSYGDVAYEKLTNQGDAADAIAAINTLSASGGNDWPEANLYALQQTAEQTTWRDDSTRVVVWFGDAPGHDPNLTGSAYYYDDNASYPGPTLAETISALNGENVIVVAVDLSGMDSYGQVTAITTATSGSFYTGGTSSSTIASLITGLVSDVFATYNEVTLKVDAPTGVDVSWTPTAYTGDFSRETTETFEFDVTFKGVAEGIYDFDIYALADKGIIATERDHITVGAPVPEPSTLLLLGAGLAGLGYFQRRRKNS
jgi:hypothetical protein